MNSMLILIHLDLSSHVLLAAAEVDSTGLEL